MGYGKWIGMGAVLVAGGALLGTWVQGCTLASDVCTCTDDFRSFSAMVVDGAGQPVDSAEATIVRLSDNRQIGPEPGRAWPGTKGYVTLFSDANLKDFPEGIRSLDLKVTVSKGGKSAMAEYTMTTDQCRCHVGKGEGPDTLVIR